MSLFLLIMLSFLILVKILETKAKNEKNIRMEKITQTIIYIYGVTISFFSNLMAVINFSLASKSLTPVFIAALIKIGVAVFAHTRKSKKFKYAMLILLVSDIIALFICIRILHS